MKTGEERPETIVEEAVRIITGKRERNYGPPEMNFANTGLVWTGLIHNKMKDGQTITAEEVALMLMGLKMCRETWVPKRDNRVDMLGYALCLDRIANSKDGE